MAEAAKRLSRQPLGINGKFIMKRINITSRNIAWIICVILLILRILFANIIGLLFPLEKYWAYPFFDISTYLFTALFIWIERKELDIFNIDIFVLLLLLFGKPLLEITRSKAFPTYNMSWYIIIFYTIISILLVLGLIINKPKYSPFNYANILWIICAIIIGIMDGIYMGYLSELFLGHGISWDALLRGPIVLRSFYYMQYAGLSEEPLFRGILWGLLKKEGISSKYILFIQAAIFVAAHFPDLFISSIWIIIFDIFIGGIILGLLAWKSKSIGPSIVAHGIGDAIGNLISRW